MSADTLQLLAIASAIILGIFICQYFRYRTAVAKNRADAEGSAAAEVVEQLRGEVVALKERVEVLEKIVTDNKYDLRARIASL